VGIVVITIRDSDDLETINLQAEFEPKLPAGGTSPDELAAWNDELSPAQVTALQMLSAVADPSNIVNGAK
jgi:hypothetical protein